MHQVFTIPVIIKARRAEAAHTQPDTFMIWIGKQTLAMSWDSAKSKNTTLQYDDFHFSSVVSVFVLWIKIQQQQ